MHLKSEFAKSVCIVAMTFSMAAAAHAAQLRTFVSGFGSDSNTASNCSHGIAAGLKPVLCDDGRLRSFRAHGLRKAACKALAHAG